MPSNWCNPIQESQPYQGSLDPVGMLRYGCGWRCTRQFTDDDALEEIAVHVAAEVPDLVRGVNLFTDTDAEVHGSDFSHLPDAFICLMLRPGQIDEQAYSIGASTPATETVSWWVVLKGRRPGPDYETAKADLLVPALEAIRSLA